MRYIMKHLKKFILILIVITFCIGTVGYYMENETVWDAMYGAFVLYFVNPVYDSKNILISIARWAAPISLGIELLLIIIQEAVQNLTDLWCSLQKDTDAIYCDNNLGDFLIKNIRQDKRNRHGILARNDNGIVRNVKSHIIMFSQDEKNLQFYEKNRHKLEGKNIFIKSEVIDSFNTNSDDIRFFNINEIIAGEYWKERNLIKYYDNDNIVIKIAIIGFNQLGQKILTCGILNNIYSLNQRIEYHIWGDSVLYKNLHSDLQMMNSDVIIYHSGSWKEDINLISDMERIIITEPDIKLLASLQELASRREIDCYDPDKKVHDICNGLYMFGQNEKILTEENIKTDNIYYFAKKLNYKYECLYGGASDDPVSEAAEIDVKWNGLDGFTKGSNIAAATYHSIRLLIMQRRGSAAVDDELAEMEHIRWCRYHFLNHWKHGQTTKKDSVRRLHPCLVPFGELSREDKDKDIEAIEVLLELNSNET